MLLDELATYLAGAGLGLTAGTSVFSAPIPDTCSVLAVGMVALPGDRPVRTFSASLASNLMERPGVQVVVRGVENGITAAATKAKMVYEALSNLGPVTLSGVRYYDVQPEGGIQGPYFDEATNRPRYLMNFSVHKDPS